MASARWREGKGRGMAQQEKHADLAMNNSSQSKLMTFKKRFNHKKSLKSHLKCVPLLPYPFSGTVNTCSIIDGASQRRFTSWSQASCASSQTSQGFRLGAGRAEALYGRARRFALLPSSVRTPPLSPVT